MAFNITANVILSGPKNLTKVRNNIKKSLSAVPVSVKIAINKGAAANVNKLNSSLRNLNATLLTTNKAARDAAASISKLAGSYSKISSKSGNIANAAKKTATSLQSTKKAVKETRSEIEAFGKDAALAVRRFSAFTLATGAIFGFIRAVQSAVSEGVRFNRELVKIVQVTGKTRSELGALTSTIDRLALSLGVNANELVEVARIFAQTGQSIQQVRASLAAVSRASLAPSFGDMKSTAEGLIAVLAQFNISAAKSEEVLGAINAVSKRFAVESEDLISVIRRAGGVFAASSKQLGEPQKRLSELLGIFTAVRSTTRESADTIATGLRTIFTRIQRPKTIEFLKQFGIQLRATAEDAKALGVAEGDFVGIFEAIRRISQSIDKLDALALAKVVEELGGIRQVGKLIPALREFSKAQAASKIALEGTDSIAKDVSIATQDLSVQIQKLSQQFDKLFRDISQSDTFQGLARLAISTASAFLSLADALRPALPLLTTIAGLKLTNAAFNFTKGFIGGIKKTNAQSLGGRVSDVVTGASKKADESLRKTNINVVKENIKALQGNTDQLKTLNNRISTLIKSIDVLTKTRGVIAPLRRATGGKITGARRFQEGGLNVLDQRLKKKHPDVGTQSLSSILSTGKGAVGAAILEPKGIGKGGRVTKVNATDHGEVKVYRPNAKKPAAIKFKVRKESLGQEDFKVVDDFLNEGIGDLLDGATHEFGSKVLGLESVPILSTAGKRAFIDGLNKGVRGTLFESILESVRTGGTFFDTTTSQAPFDFVDGFPDVLNKTFSSLSGIKYIDAKNSAEKAQLKDMTAKVKAQLQLESQLLDNPLNFTKIATATSKRKKSHGGEVATTSALLTPGELIIPPDLVNKIGVNKLDELRTSGDTSLLSRNVRMNDLGVVGGVGNSDSVSAKLPTGSYVLPKDLSEQLLSERGGVPRKFNRGGYVGSKIKPVKSIKKSKKTEEPEREPSLSVKHIALNSDTAGLSPAKVRSILEDIDAGKYPNIKKVNFVHGAAGSGKSTYTKSLGAVPLLNLKQLETASEITVETASASRRNMMLITGLAKKTGGVGIHLQVDPEELKKRRQKRIEQKLKGEELPGADKRNVAQLEAVAKNAYLEFRPEFYEGIKQQFPNLKIIRRAQGGEAKDKTQASVTVIRAMPGEAIIPPNTVKRVGLNNLRNFNRTGDISSLPNTKLDGLAIVSGFGNADTETLSVPTGSFIVKKKSVEKSGINDVDTIKRFRSGGLAGIPKFQGGGQAAGGVNVLGLAQAVSQLAVLGSVISTLDFSTFDGLVASISSTAFTLSLMIGQFKELGGITDGLKNIFSSVKGSVASLGESAKGATEDLSTLQKEAQKKRGVALAAERDVAEAKGKKQSIDQVVSKVQEQVGLKREAVRQAAGDVDRAKGQVKSIQERLSGVRQAQKAVASDPTKTAKQKEKELANLRKQEAVISDKLASAENALQAAMAQHEVAVEKLVKAEDALAQKRNEQQQATEDLASKEERAKRRSKAASQAEAKVRQSRGTIAQRRKTLSRSARLQRIQRLRGGLPSRFTGLSGKLGFQLKGLTNVFKGLGGKFAGLFKGALGGPGGIAAAIASLAAGPLVDKLTESIAGKQKEIAGVKGFSAEQGGRKAAVGFGALKGGVQGAAGGAAIGALFGPIGAAIGGLIGGLAGAAKGAFTALIEQVKFENLEKVDAAARNLSGSLDKLQASGFKSSEALLSVANDASLLTAAIEGSVAGFKRASIDIGSEFGGALGNTLTAIQTFGNELGVATGFFGKAAVVLDHLAVVTSPLALTLKGLRLDKLANLASFGATGRIERRRQFIGVRGGGEAVRKSLAAISDDTLKKAQDSFVKLRGVIIDSIPTDELDKIASLDAGAKFADLIGAMKAAGDESLRFKSQLQAFESLRGVVIIKNIKEQLSQIDKALQQTGAGKAVANVINNAAVQAINAAQTGDTDKAIQNYSKSLNEGLQKALILRGSDLQINDILKGRSLADVIELKDLGSEEAKASLERLRKELGLDVAEFNVLTNQAVNLAKETTKAAVEQAALAARMRLVERASQLAAAQIDAFSAAMNRLTSGISSAVGDFQKTVSNINTAISSLTAPNPEIRGFARVNVFEQGGVGRSAKELEAGVERVRKAVGGSEEVFKDLASTVQLANALPQALKDTIADINIAGKDLSFVELRDQLIKNIPNFDQLSDVVQKQLISFLEATFAGNRENSKIGVGEIVKQLESGDLSKFTELSIQAAQALEQITNDLNSFSNAILESANMLVQAANQRAAAELRATEIANKFDDTLAKFKPGGLDFDPLQKATDRLKQRLEVLLNAGGAGPNAAPLPQNPLDAQQLLARRKQLLDQQQKLLQQAGATTGVAGSTPDEIKKSLESATNKDAQELAKKMAENTAALDGTNKALQELGNNMSALEAIQTKLSQIQEARLSSRQRARFLVKRFAEAKTPGERAKIREEFNRPAVALSKVNKGIAINPQEAEALSTLVDDLLTAGKISKKRADEIRAKIQKSRNEFFKRSERKGGAELNKGLVDIRFGLGETTAGSTKEEKKLLAEAEKRKKNQQAAITGVADQNAQIILEQQKILQKELTLTQKKLLDTGAAFTKLRQQMEALLDKQAEVTGKLETAQKAKRSKELGTKLSETDKKIKTLEQLNRTEGFSKTRSDKLAALKEERQKIQAELQALDKGPQPKPKPNTGFIGGGRGRIAPPPKPKPATGFIGGGRGKIEAAVDAVNAMGDKKFVATVKNINNDPLVAAAAPANLFRDVFGEGSKNLTEAAITFSTVFDPILAGMNEVVEKLNALPTLQIQLDAKVGPVQVVLNGAEILSQFGERVKAEILTQVGEEIKKMGLTRNAAGELPDVTLT